ncbi:putative KAP-like P-loop ATPase [Marinilabilia salmonicolor]|jgi:predicted KAP-like P-loop ATPase|uniref:KAP family P-loop NTPase fold protein n=1 Tax=Marinilabilia salmonicolor TaxID=989 RepID=UPI000D059689|nr:P-loop NTPase fold protein [Marinilabilia salmonicolor]PRY91908.1 putative KAP-like P-loop ATPase [Marinilabilia salmonicolor]
MWKDSETNIDLLDFDYLIGVTKNIIINDELSPSSIGVYGDWGSGKSSLIEMTLSELSRNKDYLCLKFNGWLFEGYEDAKTALIGTILDEINGKKTPTGKAKDAIQRLYKNIDFFKLASKGIEYGLGFLLTGGIGTVADITMQSVISKVKEKASDLSEGDIKDVLSKTLKSDEIRKKLKTFHSDFSELLKETKIKRLVIFIDDLDRCNPDTILATFEAIRLFLFTEGTSFIIGADERQVMYAVRKKFPEIKGNKIDIGKEYLEKIIQYPVKIPQLGVKEVQFYIMCLLLKYELKEKHAPVLEFIQEERQKDFLNFTISFSLVEGRFPNEEEKIKEVISLANQLSAVLSKGLNGNPRHCKRFLNSLSMRITMAKIKKIDLDKKVLSKLMLLEYFKDNVFKELGEMQSNEKGLPEEIKYIENDKWDKVEKLKLWKDDDWFINWIKIEPKLSETNLQPYFYFSRESLQLRSTSEIKQLSLEAENILSGLLSGSDSARTEALKKANLISDFESAQVLRAVISEIETASDISAELFKSFISWGGSRPENYTDTIACLNAIPSGNIKVSFIPRIKEFASTSNKVLEINELLEKWQKDNPRLKNAIGNEIK